MLGATVIAFCHGADKAQALQQMGADHVIDSAADPAPLRQQVKVSSRSAAQSPEAALLACTQLVSSELVLTPLSERLGRIWQLG